MKENADRRRAVIQLLEALKKCDRPDWFERLKVALEKAGMNNRMIVKYFSLSCPSSM